MKLQLRIGGHETFYPRERWLYKGLMEREYLSEKNFFNQEEEEYPTDLLGVGVNMVKSIRYWITAFGIIQKESNIEIMSQWAKELISHDPYMDSISTSWILHYRLVTNDNGPSSWKWFFSETDSNRFDKNSWVMECKNWLEKEFKREVSERSISNDFSTMMGMYALGEKKDHFYPSPFLPLELIRYDEHLKKYFRNQNIAIPPVVLLYLLILYKNSYFSDTGLLDLDYIRRLPDSPTRIFRLETDTVFEIFDKLPSHLEKKIQRSRTAGMKTIELGDLDESKVLKEVYKIGKNLSFSISG
jgi:hypothetical protein